MSTPDDQPDQDRPPAGRRRAKIEIDISGDPADLREDICDAARRAIRSQGCRAGVLEIAVVGDAEMRRQHQTWMGLDSSTDVLTFDLRDPDMGPESKSTPGRGCTGVREIDGQLIVCKSVAKRRARSRGTDWRAELLLYVVHGCLHLCGHDDHDPAAAKTMHEEEDRILTALGWGCVFSRPRHAAVSVSGGTRSSKQEPSEADRKRRGGQQ